MRHRYLLLPLLLIFAACEYIGIGEKYPFPPQFVGAADVCISCLSAPPAPNSAVEKNEIVSILFRQKELSEKDKATIMAEDNINPNMMVEPVLGSKYNEATHPILFSLMRHAASDAWRVGNSAQDHWGRTRPWLTDSRVQLLVSSIKRPSYPSGHATTNYVWAYMLSDLFPAKRKALFKRADEVGMHRVDAGVHYPSDVEAGKQLAAMIYEKMKNNPIYQAELAAARKELKSRTPANDNKKLPRARVKNCNIPEANCH